MSLLHRHQSKHERSAEFWPDPDTDTIGQLPDLEQLPDPVAFLRVREPEPLPPLPGIDTDPDAPCAVCGATDTFKLPANQTGRYREYPLCADESGCVHRVIHAAKTAAIPDLPAVVRAEDATAAPAAEVVPGGGGEHHHEEEAGSRV